MRILVPNLGSTSLKYQLFDMPSERVLARGRLERVKDYAAAVRQIDTQGHAIDAVAFKAVHAGPEYRGTFRVDDGVLNALREFLPAAPAHNAIYLTGIAAFAESMPGVPLIAAFETEFHATMPEYARHYGVPADWRARGIARYGFHGASHQYVSERTAELVGRDLSQLRTISCHLGGSSSICAIDRGRSVDTTMGFSPQSGLENATRHGDLDVFAVLYMMEREGWSVEEVRRRLAQTGGLAGLSGVEGGDVRDMEQAGTDAARMALDVFTYQVRKTIGAYAAAMAGVDAVAFAGGIGENSPAVRASALAGLDFLGVRLSAERNKAGSGDRIISASDSQVQVLVVATNEELVVARRGYRCLAGSR